MISRKITIPDHHFFLFGPRGVGKSTLLEQKLIQKYKAKVLYINLLNADDEETFSRNPDHLFDLLAENKVYRFVVIDEVQKIPKLLDVVHRCIEKFHSIQFALTGSSARKLKRGHANLLAGRAFSLHLHPFTHLELPDVPLKELLMWGGLPKVWNLKNALDKIRFLKSYSQTYLKEEIQLEQIVRNINSFRQFLDLAAQANGEIVNYTNIANKSGVDETSVARYFEILVDTMIGSFLEPYDESVRVRQSQKPKFYLFDVGVYRSLVQIIKNDLIVGSSEYGRHFEHFIINECFRLNDYFETDYRFYYLRTKDGAEIDLIVKKSPTEKILIEIKSTTRVQADDYRHLLMFKKSIQNIGLWVVCNEKRAYTTAEGIRILPWKVALKELFKS